MLFVIFKHFSFENYHRHFRIKFFILKCHKEFTFIFIINFGILCILYSTILYFILYNMCVELSMS